MTFIDQPAGRQDPETPESVITRFGIETLDENFSEFTVVASMPAGHLVNPFTGMPTVGPLAILVDDVGGRANFYRRGSGQWTVSSELTVELSPDGIDSLQAAPPSRWWPAAARWVRTVRRCWPSALSATAGARSGRHRANGRDRRRS